MQRITCRVVGCLLVAMGLAVSCGGDSGSAADPQGNAGSTATGTGGSSASGGSASSGGVQSSSTFTGDSIALEDYTDEAYAALCRFLVRCWSPIYTEADCAAIDLSQIAANFEAVVAAVSDGRVIYDAAAAAEVVKTLDTLSCTDSSGTLDQETTEDVFAGTVALGGSCTIDEECVGEAACVGNGTCPGICTAKYATGQACADSSQCASGHCRSSVCVVPLALGATCTVDDECTLLSTCLENDSGTLTCQSMVDELYRNTLGEACGFDGQGYCTTELSCASGDSGGWPGTCVAKTSTGGACRLAFPSMCPEGQYCQIASGTNSGTCTDVTEECGVFGMTSVTCPNGGHCIDSVCVAPLPNGSACTDDIQCASEICSDGVCAAELDCEKGL